MRPTAVTFDFWNTIVRTQDDVLARSRRDAVSAVIAGHGLEVADAALDGHFADAGRLHDVAWRSGAAFSPQVAAEALSAAVAPPRGRARADVHAAFLEAGAHADLPLAPGIEDVLVRLSRAGVLLGIVCDVGLTGSSHLRAALERKGVLRHFASWAFSDDVGTFKPSPVIFAKALAGLGSPEPADCLHVGDLRRTDVAGARAAGMRTVRYRGLHDDRTDEPDADHVITGWAELLDLVDLDPRATAARGGSRP